MLFVSDGEQTVDAAPGKTLLQTAIDAAALVKGDNVTVFAWGFGVKVSPVTLEQIATDPSKAVLKDILAELDPYLAGLEATVCNESPSPPSPAPESYESYSYGDMICQDKCRDSPCQFCLCACKFECLDTC